MFVAADEASPLAAFLNIPDPVKDEARIREAVQCRLHGHHPRR